MEDSMKVRATGHYGLVHPRIQAVVVVSPGDRDRDSEDPIVVEHPWAFESVETATAAPGEKRAAKPRTPRKKPAAPKASSEGADE
jgi:hypothetical protein